MHGARARAQGPGYIHFFPVHTNAIGLINCQVHYHRADHYALHMWPSKERAGQMNLWHALGHTTSTPI